MLKFILYLILFYFIIRFLRGLFQTNVIVKNYHYHGENQKDKPEGDVKIIQGKEKKSKGGKPTDNMGDYVDYEEVK